MILRRVLVSACLCVFLSFGKSARGAEVMTGQLKNVEGTVEICARGTQEWRKAEDGIAVRPGDKISTGMRGRAVLEFSNSRTNISPMTQFVVGRTMEDSEKFYTEFFLQVGKVVSEINPNSGKLNKFNVTTPSAVCGIRGSKQEVGHFPQTGTEMKMLEGHGYMGAVKPENLPSPVQAVLGVSPPRGAAAKVENEVAAFNQWIQESEGNAEGKNADEKGGLLDEKTLDFVCPAGAGQSMSARDMNDPSSVMDVSQSLAGQAVPDITPSAISEKERIATQVTAEPVDQPVTLILRTDAAVTAGDLRTATETAVTTSATSTIRFPNRPGQ